MRGKDKPTAKEVTWALVEPTGQVGDKGSAIATPTKFGYEVKFKREITVLSGDRLLIDWEQAYE